MAKGIFFDRGKPRLNQAAVIIVEGTDDAYFLDELLPTLNLTPSDIGVCIAEGKDNFGSLLTAMLKSPGFTTGKIRKYAVIRDVDEDMIACTREIHKLFTDAGEPVPRPSQTVLRQDGRHVGLYLMPTHTQTGSLETLALATKAADPLLQLADQFIVASIAQGAPAGHRDKRRAQAYLSVATSPLCAGTGWAARQGVYDVASPQLQALKDFVSEFMTV